MSRRKGRIVLLSLAVLILLALVVRLRHDFQQPSGPPRDLAEAERRARARPDDLQAQLEEGSLLFQAARLDEAAEVFAHASELVPNDARPYVWWGMVAVRQKRTEQAKENFIQALRLTPEDADVWRALAELQQRDHQAGDALASYTHVTQLRPQDAFAWKQIGTLHIEANRLAQAQETLQQALKLEPNDKRTLALLGSLYLRQGELTEAKPIFDQMLKQDPTDTEALTGAAEATLQMAPSPTGLAHAQQQLAEVVRLHPTGKAHLLLGRIALLRRDPKSAVTEFQQALALDRAQRLAYNYLSQAYAALGQADRARKAAADYQAAEARHQAEAEASRREGKDR